MAKTSEYGKTYRGAIRIFGRPIVRGGSVVRNALVVGDPRQVAAALRQFSPGQLRRALREDAVANRAAADRGWTTSTRIRDLVQTELRRRG